MKNAVICFTRVPQPGKTKTRLLPILTGDQCAALHTAFLKDLSRMYRQVDADLFVAYTPDPDWPVLQDLFPSARDFFPQTGSDLGEKMYNAIAHVLGLGYDACILTGADLPLMTAGHIDAGFAALQSGDLSIGPTSDGGYYLIGMKIPCMEVFHVPNYGSASVYDNTVAAAKASGLQITPAQTCDDVDTPEDLHALADVISPDTFTGAYLDYLKKEGILL